MVTERKQGAKQTWGASGILAIALGLFTSPARAEPFKLLAIGDSLTTRYELEAPFSAPSLDPTNPNTRNWVEILGNRRSSDITLTSSNFAIPGSTADYWDDVLTDTSFNPATIALRLAIQLELQDASAALIFLGGNDLKSNYSGIYSNAAPPAFLGSIPGHILSIQQFIRSRAPANLPIVIATLPDISATPEIALATQYSDPELATRARQRIASVNADVMAMASTLPNTYIARIDSVTDRIHDQVPFHMNGTLFAFPPDSENPPLHLFCRDGFHPSTGAQALIANEILKAINTFAATPIPLFTNREILTILGQNPDQPLIDYVAGAPDDGDGLPALIEYLLGTNPAAPNSPFTFSADGSATYTPSETALRYADLSVLQSATLTDDWSPVPPANIEPLPNGSMKIVPTVPKLFYKFLATPKP